MTDESAQRYDTQVEVPRQIPGWRGFSVIKAYDEIIPTAREPDSLGIPNQPQM